MKEKKILFLFLLFSLASAFFAFFFGYKISNLEAEKKIKKVESEKVTFLEEQKKIKEQRELEKKKKEERQRKINKIFSDLDAKAILIKETNGKEIFSENKNQILPIASLTKIVNSIVALNSGEKYVYITERALRSNGWYGLIAGEKFKMENAVRFMMIESVNDMASAISFGPNGNIATHWKNFMEKMNAFVQKNKIQNTLFFSENGLDINGHILGAYSTAEDISKITDYFFLKYPDLAQSIAIKNTKICSNWSCHKIQNTNILLEKYPEIIFSKTGYTHKAGGSIAAVVKINQKLFTIVILDSTKEGRFKVLSRIIDNLKLMQSKNF